MNRILRKPKRLIAFMILSVMILGMCIPAYAQPATVSDIENHWAKQEISSWIQQGFITGYPDGTFKPNNNISRAEFISLVNRLFAFSEKATVSFTDVKESDWFYGELAKGEKAGYLSIYKGTIDANGLITRQEVAAIAAKVKALKEDPAGADSFTDAVLIPTMFKGAVGAIAKAKVMNGYQDGKFEPAKNITRAESVVTLNRLFNLKNEAVKIEAINDQSVSVGYTTAVALKVQPADAKISVQNSNDKVVQATINGSNINLKGLAAGTAVITLTGKKDGMQDGVVKFNVTVSVATTSGGGGGGGGSSHHHDDGGTNPPPTPTENDNALTYVQAIGTMATEVSGEYISGITKVVILYGSDTAEAILSNGSFKWNIFPGLANGTEVTVKGYKGTELLDTDVVKVGVAAERPYLSNLKATGTMATQVTGNYAPSVTRIVAIYGEVTAEANMANGSFTCNLVGVTPGTAITVKAYVGTELKDTKTVTLAGEPPVQGPYLTDLNATGTMATQVTGKYASSVTRIVAIYGEVTAEANMANGSFTCNLVGVIPGTAITVEAYVGTALKETKTVTLAGEPPVGGPMISDAKAELGVGFVYVSGKYVTGVTKVEVTYNNITKSAKLKSDGTFTYSIVQVLPAGTEVTVKAFVGDVVKTTLAVYVQ